MAATTPLFKVFMPPTVRHAMEETLYSGFIAEGDKVKAFQETVSSYLDCPHVVMTNACTMALTISFRLAGVGPGDEVISTPLTCIASNMPLVQLGAKPVWADVDPHTGMMDPTQIEALITERTKAILVLHKEGDLARLDEIIAIARRRDLKVIEDAAHALGAQYKGKRVGSHGDYVCFSLQAIKHITTGDGGILVCRNPEDQQRARAMKWFGIDRENRNTKNPWEADISDWGFKGNMTDISATIGLEQMNHLDEIVGKFNHNGRSYTDSLSQCAGATMIQRDPENFSTYWAYSMLAENRDQLVEKLNNEGVAAGPIHLRNDMYSIFKSSQRDLPNCGDFSARELCLPCGWWVTDEERERICRIIASGW